ncbi:unnamed protein product [Ixodes pacificus]
MSLPVAGNVVHTTGCTEMQNVVSPHKRLKNRFLAYPFVSSRRGVNEPLLQYQNRQPQKETM